MCKLNTKELSQINEIKKHYKYPQASLIEVLKIVQENRGWISDFMVKEIAYILDISSCEVDSVATFYSQIFRKPVGRNIVRYCDSVVCFLNGYLSIKKALKKTLKISLGQTTKDFRYTLLPTCCLGACDQGPVLMINKDLICHVKVAMIPKILDIYK
ncbi:NADH-quinone oxidoreductase subunit NuoE [Buchnera aphidicola]|uniref:NADH-quinone oxidoreductase subunit NuoE n=1 Tax=Buchnera aphidicola TaxID=9 RepID=UPI0031B6D2B8